MADLYKNQATRIKASKNDSSSYLQAQNGQFLGEITRNAYDSNSLLNDYGPYGSEYSPTSIFNRYSQYGSEYGSYSIRNAYCQYPPKLFIKGKFFKYITDNQYINPRISSKIFFYNLENNIDGLINGKIIESEKHLRQVNGESYIQGADGQYLGSLSPNEFRTDSIFNKFNPYGSPYSSISIFNQYSPYASPFSQLSAYNKYAQNPPKIFLKGKFHAYLTTNSLISPRINPDKILDWAKEHVDEFNFL